MVFAILHLSDLHIKNADDAILHRAAKICAAAQSLPVKPQSWAVVCGGDVAFSGKSSQYELARTFFQELDKQLGQACDHITMLSVPGNHDLDFDLEEDDRPILIDHLTSRLDKVQQPSSIAARCTSIQNQFFEFEAACSGDVTPSDSRLLYVRTFKVGEKMIGFRCLNSAWLSRKHESQGDLLYPPHLLESDRSELDYSVSILHHPYNWYESTNARHLRTALERVSDVILTGHEHDGVIYRKQQENDDTLDYIEAPVLQEHHSSSSGFNVITVDLEQGLQAIVSFNWDGLLYQPTREFKWTKTSSNSAGNRSLSHTSSFTARLDDPGTGFNHAGLKRDLRLSDIFIYPDLAELSLTSKAQGADGVRTVRSESVLQTLLGSKAAFIVGAERSGKTSLAKRLCYEFQQQPNLHPLLMNGTSLRMVRSELELTRIVDADIATQYGANFVQLYKQAPHESRVVIVDDFHECGVNRRGQNVLLRLLTEQFHAVIVIGDEVLKIAELTEKNDDRLVAFQQFEIREIGHRLREQLIRKWIVLGREFIVTDSQVDHAVAQADQLVQTLLGRNLIPSFPVNVLTILQISQAQKTHNMESGAYGYLYGVLITSALSSRGGEPADLDTKFTYLSKIAFALFESTAEVVTRIEIDRLTTTYFEEYRIDFSRDGMIDELIEARILDSGPDGLRFRYKYAYYFFVAKYFQEALNNVRGADLVRAQLRKMADRIVNEDNANILMFYVYFTRDRELIEHLLTNAQKIYADYMPVDFSSDVEFLNKLIKDAPKPLALPEGDVEENRRRYNHDRDCDSYDGRVPSLNREIEYDRQLDDLTKINIAFKTLQIVGQVVRNFPGSLRANLKHRLTRECYLLGLRTTHAILGLAEQNLEHLRLYFSELIKEHRAIRDEGELAKTTDELVLWLAGGSAFGMLKRISQAIGLEKLQQTFGDVLEEEANNKLSFNMIDLTIRFDHFATPPVLAVKNTAKQLSKSKNWFAYKILQTIVANHLYLYHVETPVRQQLAAAVGIEGMTPRMLSNPEKR